MSYLSIDVIKIFALGILGFMFSAALTPVLTHFLFKYKFWKKNLREKSIDGKDIPNYRKFYEDTETKKPRAGGLLIWLTPLALAFLFFLLSKTGIPLFEKINFLSREQTWLPLFALVAGAIIGLADDLLSVINLKKYFVGGLRMRHRLLAVFLIGLVGALWFYFKLDWRTIHIPGNGEIYIGALYILLFVLVNMAIHSSTVIDGLDGLSGGTFACIFAAFAIIAFWRGQINLAGFCSAVLGALLSFLWFNIPPARFVMGETGILGLGTALTVVAFLTDSVLVLPIIAFLLVVESSSVIIQLLSKKYLKKKVFLAAPIHHHFQAKGWPHYKVTMRMWVIGVVMAIIGVAIRMLG